MREQHLCHTKNVKKANNFIDLLINRPKFEMVGLGMIYGEPGVGKTSYAKNFCMESGAVYFRLESAMSCRSFAIALLQALCNHSNTYYKPTNSSESTTEIVRKILGYLHENQNTMIFIDEINIALNNAKILGTIRDIVDITQSIVILIGMNDAQTRLLQNDKYYYDRCNFFCEFMPLAIDDIALICNEKSDVKINQSVFKRLKELTNGNIRRLIKLLNYFEFTAKSQNIREITIEHLVNTKETFTNG